MSKKTAGLDLINSILGKCPLTHHFYLNYHLVSFDLYAENTLHTSRAKTRSYFKDQPVYRYEV